MEQNNSLQQVFDSLEAGDIIDIVGVMVINILERNNNQVVIGCNHSIDKSAILCYRTPFVIFDKTRNCIVDEKGKKMRCLTEIISSVLEEDSLQIKKGEGLGQVKWYKFKKEVLSEIDKNSYEKVVYHIDRVSLTEKLLKLSAVLADVNNFFEKKSQTLMAVLRTFGYDDNLSKVEKIKILTVIFDFVDSYHKNVVNKDDLKKDELVDISELAVQVVVDHEITEEQYEKQVDDNENFYRQVSDIITDRNFRGLQKAVAVYNLFKLDEKLTDEKIISLSIALDVLRENARRNSLDGLVMSMLAELSSLFSGLSGLDED